MSDSSLTTEDKGRRAYWRRLGLTMLFVIPYLLPLFWMFDRVSYPDSLSVHIAARGKAGVLEDWFYSYLLLQRHHSLDVVLFAYMWLPILGLVAWLGWAASQDLKASRVRKAEAEARP